MDQAKPLIRPCTRVWLLLVALTLVTFGVGEAGLGGTRIMLAVLAITLLKSQMVAGFFMGLRRTRLMWRLIMLAYLAVVGGMIALAYLMGVK